ncbi:hypothetical protein CWO17_15655 [Vibrio sp. 10N.286.45.A3]|uniref:hypothetical protein n=1 Tax=unclassified Vibrio TaxID=2614977 RepID=UPI000D3AB38B|nr:MULTISPECIES: hypothetical protein [unclassified Vibrio]PTP01530.1 hypothetical protein CWO17_15655 [Vibrio sp. 10N.286.45.A3]TKE82388.1 hypothetical protein FCV56_12645 [Vibrio sp. F12]TKE98160.1 hypothetical protein FCV61_11775 [Vibrio sp. F12]
MERIQLLRKEALSLRYAMELCSKGPSTYPTPNFPIMNCKFASLLLTYHYFQLLDDVEITMVTGLGEKMVSHVWLEIDGHVFDVTGDQYNLIEDYQLYAKIIEKRPYSSVHIEECSQSYLYQIFDRTERMPLERGFAAFKPRFVNQMEESYEYLKQSMASSRFQPNHFERI